MNLGKKLEKLGGASMPEGPAPKSADEMYYPCLCIDGMEGLAFPESGSATIRFKVRRMSAEKDNKGETSASVCLDVISIDGVKGDTRKKSAIDAFEDTAKSVLGDKYKDED